MNEDAQFTEYLVSASESETGRAFPPFIVIAASAEAAQRLSERRYLTIHTVEPYVPADGEPRPKVYERGPPLSDKKFDQTYQHRPAENEPGQPLFSLFAGSGGGGSGTPLFSGLGFALLIFLLLGVLAYAFRR